jgi:hypothetical protein
LKNFMAHFFWYLGPPFFEQNLINPTIRRVSVQLYRLYFRTVGFDV